MFFGNRIYGNRVLARVEAMAQEVHAAEDLVDCMAAFTTVNMSLASHSGLDLKAIFKQYRKSGFSVDEAAIALIDGTVSALKEVAKRRDSKEAGRPIALLEALIDSAVHLPTKILPRNGKFAKAAEESGLAKFFKE